MEKVLIINYPSSGNDFRLRILYNLMADKYEMVILSSPLWGDTKKKLAISKNPFLLVPNIIKYVKYIYKIFKCIKKSAFKHIIVGYPAYLEIFVLRFYLLFSFKKKSIFTDFFLSSYDTIVLDRKIVKDKSLKAYFYFFLDKLLLKLSSCIITDTNANSARYANLFNIGQGKFRRIFVGSMLSCDNVYEKILSGWKPVGHQGKIYVGWVGSFIPLHGIDKIIESAKLLSAENVEYHIVGNSQEHTMENMKEAVHCKGISNIVFHGKLNYKDSIELLNNCDICLGIFGNSDKAKSVIPFKIFDYLNLNKPIVTQTSEVMKEISEINNIFLVDNSPECIAEKIKKIGMGIDAVKANDVRKILKNMILDDIKKCFISQ